MNIVITAGGTSEHIDAVRAITNTGTGTLASIIANKFVDYHYGEFNKIFYIHTTNAKLPDDSDKIELIQVEDTMSVYNAVQKVLKENKIDYFIHAMAISDYYVDFVSTADRVVKSITHSLNVADDKCIELRPDDVAKTFLKGENRLDNSKKLSSNEDNLVVVLRKTPKIIGSIKEISPDTRLIGFKLLNNVSVQELVDVAYALLMKNSCDYVIANDSNKITRYYHEAHFVDKNKNYTTVYSNEDIAKKLIEIIFD